MASAPDLEPPFPTLLRDGAGSGCGFQQCRHHQFIGIGETGFFPADRPNADPLLDRMAGGFNLAILQTPGFRAALLEIQIAAVNGMAEEATQGAMQIILAETSRR